MLYFCYYFADGITIDCVKIRGSLEGNFLKCQLRQLVTCKAFPSKSNVHEVKYFPASPEDMQMIKDIVEAKVCASSRVLFKTVL